MANFWPGLLSLNLKPQRGLNWDLGDGQQLDSFSVRVPSAEFILQLAKTHGPLAVASAALSGKPAISDPIELNFSEIEVAAIFSSGPLTQGLASSVVACDGDKPRIIRVGAISAQEITRIAPDISGE
jgi:tRNA A37 threonylcarbamoyladenosine synthetase subunit TsaC/SUA5/YrdC